jgi:DNA ligase-1
MAAVTPLSALVATSGRIRQTRSRTAKVQELAALLRALQADEIGIATRYLSGETPQGRIGVGYATLQTAAAQPPAGLPTLTVADVDAALELLGGLRGAGSAARRAQALDTLFARATAPEQEFLLHLLAGELRHGALEGVMLDAVAAAAGLPAARVRRAAMYASDLGAVASVALTQGAAALERFQLKLFAPVVPMLAHSADDVGAALQQLGGEAAFEWKMDGARIQVHRDGSQVRIYTRALNEVTAAVPEIVELVQELPAAQLILDGEAIAFDSAGRPHPFQVTMRRFGRKLGVQELRGSIVLRAYFFDCLRLGERTLADLPTQERCAALAQVVPPHARVPRLVSSSATAAQRFYEEALAAGHEGVMAKALDAPYEAGNRGASWLKIKRAHTLDLVVLAAEWGHGRRSGRLSNLHLGALDPGSGAYVMLGKTFKGLTDETLEWQTHELLAREVRRDASTVYVRPELVVEIAFSDLQSSTRYPGGVALRLARVKGYRPDKSAAAADTMEEVRRVFAAQQGPGETPPRP